MIWVAIYLAAGWLVAYLATRRKDFRQHVEERVPSYMVEKMTKIYAVVCIFLWPIRVGAIVVRSLVRLARSANRL